MRSNDGLRGMAALGSLALSSKGKRGGGKKSARGAMNAAHRVLTAAGKPMNGKDITAHAMGLGYWQSDAGSPTGVLVHSLNVDSKTEDGIFLKVDSGVYGLRKSAGLPMPVSGPDTPDPLVSATYVVMVKSGSLEELPGVELPPVKIKPIDIAVYMALPEGKTLDDADDATKAQIVANAETITRILKG